MFIDFLTLHVTFMLLYISVFQVNLAGVLFQLLYNLRQSRSQVYIQSPSFCL